MSFREPDQYKATEVGTEPSRYKTITSVFSGYEFLSISPRSGGAGNVLRCDDGVGNAEQVQGQVGRV